MSFHELAPHNHRATQVLQLTGIHWCCVELTHYNMKHSWLLKQNQSQVYKYIKCCIVYRGTIYIPTQNILF